MIAHPTLERGLIRRVALLSALLVVLPLGATSAEAQLSANDAKCRRTIAKAARKLGVTTLKESNRCHKRRMLGKVSSSVDCNLVAQMPGSAKIDKAAAKLVSKAQKRCDSASPPASNGYLSCGAPCAFVNIVDYASVGQCVSCVTQSGAQELLDDIHGAPAVPGANTVATKCLGSVGKAMRTYIDKRAKVQQSCQYDDDLAAHATDCLLKDSKGKIAKALSKLRALVARCAPGALPQLDSCSTSVAGEQACVASASATATDDLFALVYPVSARSVTIYRDTYGIPHIQGSDMAAAMYGFGYAQAEDHLETVLVHVAVSNGDAASYLADGAPAAAAAGYFGSLVDHDRASRQFRVRAVIDARWSEINDNDPAGWDSSSRQMLDAFAAGIERYMADVPASVPAWWSSTLTGKDILAWTRRFLLSYQMALVEEKLSGVPRERDMSNQWVVGPGRTADGSVMLQADPHLPWNGATLWYEAHVSGGPLNVAGGTLYGMPFIPMAHNEHLAFSETSNAMDNADVFVVQVDPADPTRYLYDGSPLPFTFEEISGTRPDGTPFTHHLAWTHHGPVVSPSNDTDFSGVTEVHVGAGTMYDQVHSATQFWAMNTADSVAEWKTAMEALAVHRWNFVVGDDQGHIFYVSNSRHPDRRVGPDWNGPVDGSDSANDWTVLPPKPFSWLAQVTDPPAGYLQNCNNSPGHVTDVFEEAIDESGYPTHYVGADSINPRGVLANRYLSGRSDWTLADLEAVSMDDYLVTAEWWVDVLAWARANFAGDPGLTDETGTDLALGLLCGTSWPVPCTAWDYRATVTSTQTALFKEWAQSLSASFPFSQEPPALDAGNPTIAALAIDALNLLANRYRYLEAIFGDPAVPWGDVHRITRGSVNEPISGVSAVLAPLRIAGIWAMQGTVGYTGFGSSYMKLVRIAPGDGVRAVSVKPWGNSDDPASPHYDDLTALYAANTYKEFWFDFDDVRANIGPMGTTTLNVE